MYLNDTPTIQNVSVNWQKSKEDPIWYIDITMMMLDFLFVTMTKKRWKNMKDVHILRG